jgi:hypothetical protein
MRETEEIPEALRPFATRLAARVYRVRISRTCSFVYVRGSLRGMLIEGEASVYFRSPDRQGQLFANLNAFDATFR